MTTGADVKTWLRRRLPGRPLRAIRTIRRVLSPLSTSPLTAPARYGRLIRQRRAYIEMGGEAPLTDLYPMLDDLGAHPVDAHYVCQAHWATRILAAEAPATHVDVASQTEFVAMLCAIVPVTYIDLRPLPLDLPGLTNQRGTVLDLPFQDRSVSSISCLHVLEHIGLGRYGDELDPEGSIEAARELERVLAPSGRLLLSLPVGRPRTEYNAHRVHAPRAISELFPALEVARRALVDDAGQFHVDLDGDDPRWRDLDYGCGMFELRRPPADSDGGS